MPDATAWVPLIVLVASLSGCLGDAAEGQPTWAEPLRNDSLHQQPTMPGPNDTTSWKKTYELRIDDQFAGDVIVEALLQDGGIQIHSAFDGIDGDSYMVTAATDVDGKLLSIHQSPRVVEEELTGGIAFSAPDPIYYYPSGNEAWAPLSATLMASMNGEQPSFRREIIPVGLQASMIRNPAEAMVGDWSVNWTEHGDSWALAARAACDHVCFDVELDNIVEFIAMNGTVGDLLPDSMRWGREGTSLTAELVRVSGNDALEGNLAPAPSQIGFLGEGSCSVIPCEEGWPSNLSFGTAMQIAMLHPEFVALSVLEGPMHPYLFRVNHAFLENPGLDVISWNLRFVSEQGTLMAFDFTGTEANGVAVPVLRSTTTSTGLIEYPGTRTASAPSVHGLAALASAWADVGSLDSIAGVVVQWPAPWLEPQDIRSAIVQFRFSEDAREGFAIGSGVSGQLFSALPPA